MSFKGVSSLSSDGKGALEEQWNYFEIGPLVWEMCLKVFLFLALVAILFSGAEPLEGHSRNIPVKLFQNPLTSLGEDVS